MDTKRLVNCSNRTIYQPYITYTSRFSHLALSSVSSISIAFTFSSILFAVDALTIGNAFTSCLRIHANAICETLAFFRKPVFLLAQVSRNSPDDSMHLPHLVPSFLLLFQFHHYVLSLKRVPVQDWNMQARQFHFLYTTFLKMHFFPSL